MRGRFSSERILTILNDFGTMTSDQSEGTYKKTYIKTRIYWLPGNAFPIVPKTFFQVFRKQIRPLSGRRNRPRICLPGDFNDIGKYYSFLCKISLCELSLSILLCWSLFIIKIYYIIRAEKYCLH